MSEISNHSQQRVNQLLELVTGLINGENGKELYEKHLEAIGNASPFEVIVLFNS